jgi:hypothetical protein
MMAALISGIWRLKRMTKDETEGRIRAIEAVLLHLPEINRDVIQAAKDWIRNPKRQPDSKVAEVKLQISGHVDEHAEKALDELTYRFQKSKAHNGKAVSVGGLFFFINGNRSSSVSNRDQIHGEANTKQPAVYHGGVGR